MKSLGYLAHQWKNESTLQHIIPRLEDEIISVRQKTVELLGAIAVWSPAAKSALLKALKKERREEIRQIIGKTLNYYAQYM